jgi:hypothetical protein
MLMHVLCPCLQYWTGGGKRSTAVQELVSGDKICVGLKHVIVTNGCCMV